MKHKTDIFPVIFDIILYGSPVCDNAKDMLELRNKFKEKCSVKEWNAYKDRVFRISILWKENIDFRRCIYFDEQFYFIDLDIGKILKCIGYFKDMVTLADAFRDDGWGKPAITDFSPSPCYSRFQESDPPSEEHASKSRYRRTIDYLKRVLGFQASR